MLRRAHDAGLRTIVGSMMESHVGVGAAAALVAAEPTTEVSDLDAAWWSVRLAGRSAESPTPATRSACRDWWASGSRVSHGDRS